MQSDETCFAVDSLGLPSAAQTVSDDSTQQIEREHILNNAFNLVVRFWGIHGLLQMVGKEYDKQGGKGSWFQTQGAHVWDVENPRADFVGSSSC
nr:unnamed protein product [Fasciola hepatica]